VKSASLFDTGAHPLFLIISGGGGGDRLFLFLFIKNILFDARSRDSLVGIATSYGLEGKGIESRWGEIFRTCPDRLRGPPSLLYNGSGSFPGVKAAGA
jgi:hypothetical protein